MHGARNFLKSRVPQCLDRQGRGIVTKDTTPIRVGLDHQRRSIETDHVEWWTIEHRLERGVGRLAEPRREELGGAKITFQLTRRAVAKPVHRAGSSGGSSSTSHRGRSGRAAARLRPTSAPSEWPITGTGWSRQSSISSTRSAA